MISLACASAFDSLAIFDSFFAVELDLVSCGHAYRLLYVRAPSIATPPNTLSFGSD